MTFSRPVKIEGKDLPAGTYGFFIALGENESTLIFSKISTSWGSFYYDSTEDALRVNVKNKTLDQSVEWLKYEFIDEKDDEVTIAMLSSESIKAKALEIGFDACGIAPASDHGFQFINRRSFFFRLAIRTPTDTGNKRSSSCYSRKADKVSSFN